MIGLNPVHVTRECTKLYAWDLSRALFLYALMMLSLSANSRVAGLVPVADYLFDLTVTNDSCSRTIEWRFEQAPLEYRFTQVHVHLRERDHYNFAQSKLIELRDNCGAFTDVSQGIYTVNIDIVDPYWNVYHKCICKTSNYRCNCRRTSSKEVEIAAISRSCTKTTTAAVTSAVDASPIKVKSSLVHNPISKSLANPLAITHTSAVTDHSTVTVPSTSTVSNRFTSTVTHPSTATDHPPSTSTVYDRSTSTVTHPSTLTVTDHPPSTAIDPSTSTVTHPSTSTVNDHPHSTSTVTHPSVSVVTGHPPSTSTVTHPSTSTVTDHPPSTSTVTHRSTYPSTSTVTNHPPSASNINDLLTSAATHPLASTLTDHSPSTSTVADHPLSTSTLADPPTVSESKQKNDDERLKYIVTPIFGVIAILMILCMILIIRKRYPGCIRPCAKQNPHSVAGPRSPTNPPDHNVLAYEDKKDDGNHCNSVASELNRRLVYLLYTEDNDHHKMAVRLLAKYLECYCRCRVMLPEWYMSDIQAQGRVNWLLQAVQNADYVLIVNSEGTYKVNQARKKNRHPKKLNEEILGNMFTPAVTYIIDNFYRQQSYNYKKYLMVQFENTLDEYMLTEINPGYKYVLMKHLPGLLRHIHEIQFDRHVHGHELCDLPTAQSHPHYYAATDEGRQLVTAIKDAHDYVKTHPNWFDEMYSYEEDNEYHSGIQPLPEDDKRDIQRKLDNFQLFLSLGACQEMDSEFDHSFLPGYFGEDQTLSPSNFTCVPPVDLYSVSTDHNISADTLQLTMLPSTSLDPAASSYQLSAAPVTGFISDVPTYQYCENLSERAKHVPFRLSHVCDGESVARSGSNHNNNRAELSRESSSRPQSSNHGNDSSQRFGRFVVRRGLVTVQDEDDVSKTSTERIRDLNVHYHLRIIKDNERSPVLLLPDNDTISLGGDSV